MSDDAIDDVKAEARALGWEWDGKHLRIPIGAFGWMANPHGGRTEGAFSGFALPTAICAALRKALEVKA